jgi:hypothetical protein
VGITQGTLAMNIGTLVIEWFVSVAEFSTQMGFKYEVDRKIDEAMKFIAIGLPLTDAPMPEVSNVVVFSGMKRRRQLGMGLPDGDDDSG